LLKQYSSAIAAGGLQGTCKYLAPLATQTADALSARRSAATPEAATFLDLAMLRDALTHRALLTVATAGERMGAESARLGGSADGAVNECGIDLVAASRAHCHLIIFTAFQEQVTVATGEDAAVGRVLAAVCALFGVITLLENICDIVGYFNSAHISAARAAVRELLDVVRADVVPLMDAFEFPDNVLNSALGCHDGNVYEALFQSTQLNPINRSEVFPGWETTLRPHLDQEFIKSHAEMVRQSPIGASTNTSKL